jgi:periplasmic protein CpxP/Spy
MKSVRFLSIGAAILLGVAALFAQGMHGHGGHGGFDFDHLLGFYSDYLDLSSAQQDQVKAIWAKEKTTIQPLMDQMRQGHQAMEALASSGAFDEAKTRALATQNAQTMIELQVQHVRIKNQMMQVLTADQKAKLQKFEAKRESHMKEHMVSPPAD